MSAPENSKPSLRIPPWLRVKLPCNHTFSDTRALVEGLDLHTVCHSAKCPNMFECFSRKTATFLILGNTCTRNCAFCNIGGGIILAECNRQFMRENGVVIYLQASVSALIDRLEAYPKAEQRPTLTGKPVREEVGEVLAQREALYRDAAHHIVDATASPDRVVEQIMTMLCGATAAPVS